jgi:two-component system, LytTR family, sensor kinase
LTNTSVRHSRVPGKESFFLLQNVQSKFAGANRTRRGANRRVILHPHRRDDTRGAKWSIKKQTGEIVQISPLITTSSRWLPQNFTLRAYIQQLPVSFALWSVVVALEGGQVFMNDATSGFILPLHHYLVWAGLDWYPWALLTPLVLALAVRYPLTRFNWPQRILYPHAIACIACVGTEAVLRGTGGYFYAGEFERFATWASLVEEALVRGFLGILAYWIIVTVAAFLHLQEVLRQRELDRAQLEARLASAELEMLRMQIQPHFLVNTLQAAITLVQEDPRAAEDVLLRLSQLLRISLDQMDKNVISLARELEFLDLYVGIQRQRFGDRLSVEVHADPATLDQSVPPLLLQPLVENAIRHGIGKHRGSDLIEVFARVENDGLEIEVWNSNSTINESTDELMLRGLGIRNTKARLEQLYGREATLYLRSLGGRGAVALIFIPLRGAAKPAPRTAEAVS